jgi:dolichyl-phosphate-mannose--protein O-mannosyl transferase
MKKLNLEQIKSRVTLSLVIANILLLSVYQLWGLNSVLQTPVQNTVKYISVRSANLSGMGYEFVFGQFKNIRATIYPIVAKAINK